MCSMKKEIRSGNGWICLKSENKDKVIEDKEIKKNVDGLLNCVRFKKMSALEVGILLIQCGMKHGS